MAGNEPDRTRMLGVAIAAVVVIVLGIVVVNSRDAPAPPSTAAPAAAAAVSPLTGEPGDPGRAVLAVKVDNSPEGRPWTGVEDADVVYVEPVESGITRLLAVFASRLPDSVGPVRSFRESDIDLLAAYGRPALAYSGSAPELDRLVASGPVVPLSADRPGPAFRRSGDRPAPHNLYGDPAGLLARARGVEGPRDVGFRFGPAPAGGAPAAAVTERVGRVDVDLRQVGDHWSVAFAGTAPSAAHPATVVVQRVAVRTSAVRDVAGSPSPTAETVGSGKVEVLRDGKRWSGTWSRPAPDAPTTFTGDDGAPLTFAAGPVWVLLTQA